MCGNFNRLLLFLVAAWCPAAMAQESATEPEVTVGSKAPEFELESVTGETFRLSSLQGDQGKYAAVVFARAHW